MSARTLKISGLTRGVRKRAWGQVALLTMVGLTLACDRNPTAPVAQPRVERSLVPPTPPVFDASQYFAISVDLAAQQQYCRTFPSVRCTNVTAARVSDHLYGWRAVVNGQQFSIDMQRAVRDQFGSDYILGAVGVGIFDWRAVHWSALVSNEVLPVMLIANDYFWNVGAVQAGLANFKSVLATTRRWYAKAMSAYGGLPRTFHVLQPLVVFLQSKYTAAQWNFLTTLNPYSGPFPGFWLTLVSNASGSAYGSVSPYGPRVLVAVFTGNSPTVFSGTFWQNYFYPGVLAPAVSSLTCSWGTDGNGLINNLPCQQATFLVAHTLGWAFELWDCSNTDPCAGTTSIMAGTWPPLASLTPSQIDLLTWFLIDFA
ncbi:MAG: hypothetical protein DMD44_16130 [Gemmatimonadetes bacterium]|nr:MAG: hypothetical protein DMD44_16130 [Gemmatimonadota bacterium]